MNRKIHIFLMLAALVMALAGTSCKSSKSVAKKSLREFTASRLIKEVENHQFDFNYLQAKLNAKIDAKGKNFTVKGQLRMQKDSIVWMSFSLPLGVEMMRVKITPDSVFMLNRNDKTYLREDIGSFEDFSPMITSIQFIQAILVGNDINLREEDDYNVAIDNGQYNLLISKELKKSIKHSDNEWKVMMKDIWIDPDLFKITKYYIKEYNNDKRKIYVEYSDFELVNGKYIPTKIDITVRGDIYMKANISYSNVVENDNLEFNFNVPKKYDRIYR